MKLGDPPMPRHVKFAIEIAAALLIAAFGAWAAAKFNGKFNRSSQAAERIALALERAYPPPKELPRPSLLRDRDGDVKGGKVFFEGEYRSCVDDRLNQTACSTDDRMQVVP